VNIWAFDSASGAPVWKGSASGESLADESFEMEVPVDPGKYDFVAWCGLEGNDAFSLANYEPSSKQELEVTLNTQQSGNLNIFSGKLLGLFHGMVIGYDYTPDPTRPDIRVVTVSLTKDTNNIHVLLQNNNGREMKPSDFSVTITDANSKLAWNNAVLAGPVVTYQPWDMKFTPAVESKAAESLATLTSEFSMNRLIAGQESWLTITRNSDKVDIIHIPLIEYLLLIKDHYGNMSDQQFLDRQDEYTLKFMLDNTDTWYIAGGIYINSWVVVPPQNAGNL
ncbi:MAG: FimB/Mfa2 family fimbrial subunit, partial [Paramuribaculum sp.]|nr:FimB/Mfa2 family fimbrial subunit [Paramuribaculum sp.]